MIGIRRKTIWSLCLGLIVSFCYVAGYYLDCYDSLNLTSVKFYLIWLLGSVPGTLAIFGIFIGTEKINKGFERTSALRKQKALRFSLCVPILLLCWTPVFLSIFPGAFSYDAYSEWEQVAVGNITAHHPVIHVLITGGLVEGFKNLTGSYNVGIAVYTILQMVILACILAKVICFFAEFELPVFFQIFALCFFGLSPVVQLFSVSVTKDTLFSAAELLFLLYVFRFYCQRQRFFSKRRYLIGFVVASFFTMVLRNNGLYIVLLVLVIMSGTLLRKKKQQREQFVKKWLMVLAGIMLLYGAYVGPFYHVLDVTPGGVEEMLSVPIQQMARVHKYEYDSLEQKDLELLYKVLPKENLDDYRATVSDFVKKGFRRDAFEENKIELAGLWAKWLVKHPLAYVNSFLINTVDFWYPHAVIDGYRDPYGKSSFFDYRVAEPGTETVLLESAHKYYETISHDKEAQKIPFAFLLLSPGWYFGLAVIAFGYLWCYKKYKFMVPMIILLLSFLTVLLGPMALVRYVLIFYFVFPVLLTFVFAGDYYEIPDEVVE